MKNLLFVFFIIILSSFLNSTIINVPVDQPTIQDGINAATNTDTVLVQPGTYYENISFVGRLITVGSLYLTTQDTTYISSTIINGNSSGIVVKFENHEDGSAILTGFTLTNGYTAHGGGIKCSNSSPSLENLIIKNNSVLNHGGGIYCGISSPSLKNVVIVNNSSDMDGGGIVAYNNSNLVLTNVTISDNFAEDEGGGIICYTYSSFSFINSIVLGNAPEDISIGFESSVSATYSNIQGIPGVGNIYTDPLFTADYHLLDGSPCIDTGDPVSPYDPDGTIADMGAFYFNQSPDPPQNVTVEIIEAEVFVSWDAVAGATSYKIYSSDDPITGFTEDLSGSFQAEHWKTLIINEKKFYYVVAVQE